MLKLLQNIWSNSYYNQSAYLAEPWEGSEIDTGEVKLRILHILAHLIACMYQKYAKTYHESI